MDVFLALVESVGTSQLQLPLKESTTLPEALQMISSLWLPSVELNVDDYKPTQAYVGEDGKTKIDIISKDTGQVLMTFVNLTSNLVNLSALPIPVATTIKFLGAPLVIEDQKELEFLEAVTVGVPLPVFDTVNDLPYQLATLFNVKNYLGRWTAGSFGYLSTCGFEVVYRGWSADAPKEFEIEHSPYVVIIRLHQGAERGYVCLRT